MPDGLVSLDSSRSWEKIYDNGEARIYRWHGENAATKKNDTRQHCFEGRQMTINPDDDNIEILASTSDETDAEADGKSLTDLVEQPAKVMRIGTMIKQLLEEVRAAPLDDASRNRLRDIHRTSIRELGTAWLPSCAKNSSG